jgi:hypothetical protein
MRGKHVVIAPRCGYVASGLLAFVVRFMGAFRHVASYENNTASVFLVLNADGTIDVLP